jgi:nicotinamide-nucleotide amidase
MQETVLEQLATSTGQALKSKKLMMTAAESCTGGWIAKLITDIPGSSEWFERGFVTYSNQSKMDLLGVSADTLQLFGAVSEQVVLQMAKGALADSRADIAVAVSGIAGPGGGSTEKPVGTVWIAWATSGKTTARRYWLPGDRNQVRAQTVDRALRGVEELIETE